MFKRILIVVLIAAAIFACSSSDDSNSGSVTNDTYNRTAMLTNIADNIIIPGYQNLSAELSTLVDSKNVFVANVNQTNLEALRTNWFNAYQSFQAVQMFQIGKAEEILFEEQMNIYPTNTTDIENNIANGNYDLSSVNNNDAVGFPAVDYMLYGVADNDAAILTTLSNTNYSTYLSDLIDRMQTLTNTVLTDWTSGYRDNYITNTANVASGAVNQTLNAYIFYYEKRLRADKVGIPAGVFSSTALPSKVEALYKEEDSKTLLLEALNSVQDVFNGKAINSDAEGESYKNYLIALDRNDLAEVINNRFDAARTKIEALNTNFKSQIETDNTKMTEAYDAIQLAVVSLKSDMISVFNISIAFEDNDGD
ncbi:imelysin family protein [Lacinutrix venerupis]|uniref:Peptidase M75 superfamily protein n=1 Tax=Lacinutrix venerupis TaxID=1486034 RepID=A0AAC9LKW2_9FLAO|nr:imelysin family protein [Lacinutrix venerupis]APY00681.1 peptidase M75 superfamily protein [Lacinutrix venerupis]